MALAAEPDYTFLGLVPGSDEVSVLECLTSLMEDIFPLVIQPIFLGAFPYWCLDASLAIPLHCILG